MATCSRCGQINIGRYVVCAACFKANSFTTKKGYGKFKDSGEYVHREIAARTLNRPLKAGEVVHHKNGNKKDNRPSNLQVLPSQAAHVRLHNAEAARQSTRTNYQEPKKRRKGFFESFFD